jgi:hypothetical protein
VFTETNLATLLAIAHFRASTGRKKVTKVFRQFSGEGRRRREVGKPEDNSNLFRCYWLRGLDLNQRPLGYESLIY